MVMSKLTSALGVLRNVRSERAQAENRRAEQEQAAGLLNQLIDEHMEASQADSCRPTILPKHPIKRARPAIGRGNNVKNNMSLTEVTLESDERRWKDFIALRVQLEQDMDGLDPWIATGLRFVRIHQVPFPRIENMNTKDPALNQTAPGSPRPPESAETCSSAAIH